eukprot:6159110-Prymnesium_polylepis.1
MVGRDCSSYGVPSADNVGVASEPYGWHARRLAMCMAIREYSREGKRARILCLLAVPLVRSIALATSRDQSGPPRWHPCLAVSVERIASSWRVWLVVGCLSALFRFVCFFGTLWAAYTEL